MYILKTYMNAGVASVYICNHKVGTIDALWTDYQNYKVSIPELQSFKLPVTKWEAYTADTHPCHPSQKNPLTLSIAHERAKDHLEARTAAQKIKILSVTVCKSKHNRILGYDGMGG
jgi:hypothetical protein